MSLVAAGFAVRSKINWAKDRLVLSRGDYHWQHEPSWYAVKKTGNGHRAGDRKQTTLWHMSGKDQDAAKPQKQLQNYVIPKIQRRN